VKLVCCVVGSLKDFGLPYRLVCCVIGLLKDFGLPCRLICILSIKRSTDDSLLRWVAFVVVTLLISRDRTSIDQCRFTICAWF